MPALAGKALSVGGARFRRLLGRGIADRTMEPGLPPGCTRAMIDLAARESGGDTLSSTRFRHLSAWKPHGAFRVEATFREGGSQTFIFKRTVATPEFNPILDRLPFTPGPPEFAICAEPPGSLGVFLPKVFLVDEPNPGVEYVMVAEDLDGAYRRLGVEDVIGLVDHLRSFHAALAGQSGGARHELLIDYLTIRDDLPTFFEYRLSEHYRERGDRLVGTVLERFEDVANAYLSFEIPDKAVGIVHGDPNLSNIRIPRAGEGPPKFVDWEWAGTHLPHIDLAAILKFATPMLEGAALRRYSDLNPEFSEEMHRKLYYWCKLDRSLLDVCLMATLAENPAPRTLDVDVFLRRSARAALHAHAQLARF